MDFNATTGRVFVPNADDAEENARSEAKSRP
jgi:hypothetical protein